MKKTVNIFLNKRLYKIVVYTVLLWVTNFPFDSLAGSITGESKVCAGQIYTYTIDPGIYALLDSKWECSPSGEFISQEKKTCKIRWNGTGELKITAKVNLRAGIFGGFWDYYVKTVHYKDIGSLSNFIITPKEASYCKGESVSLSVNKDDLNSEYSYTYKWERYYNGNIEYTYSTSSPELNYTISKDDGKYEFKVYALETDGCLSENTDLSKDFLVKSSKFQSITIDKTDPTCFDGRNATITLNNIPDYEETNLFKNNYFPAHPDSFEYNITISDFDLVYNANHEFDYVDKYTIDQDDLLLINQNNKKDTIRGLGTGYYIIQIENSYFCKEERNIPFIDQPPQFLITSLEKLGQYSYDNKTYNIKTYGGTDTIRLSLENGQGGPVNYYYNEGSSVLVGNSTNFVSTVTLAGIDSVEHNIYAVDGKGCKSTTQDFDLSAPKPFTYIIESFAPDCHSENIGNHNNGVFTVTCSGGIGPYKILDSTNDDLIDFTKDNDFNKDPYVMSSTGKTGDYPVKITDIANVRNETINIPSPYELKLKIEDIITSECFGFNDGQLNVVPYGRKEDEYDYSILGGSNYLTTYTGDTAYYSGLESNTTYNVDVTVKKTVAGGSIIECSEDVSYTFTGYADPLGFNIFDTIPPICYEGIDGKIILEPFGGHQDGNYNYSNFSASIINGSLFPAPSIKNLGSNVLIDTIRSYVEYEIEITDAEGCNTIDTIRVTRNQNPVQFQFLDSAEIQCNKYDNGWVQLEGVGGDNSSYGYDYYIFPEYNLFEHASETPIIDTSAVKYGEDITFYNLAPGYYNVYVADSNDCLHPNIECDIDFYKKEIFVYEPPIIEVEYWNTGISQKGKSDAKLWFNADGGNYSFIYELESADTLVASGSTKDSIQIDNLAEGIYTLKIKDTCNCSNKPGLEWMFYEGIRIESPNEYLSLSQGPVQSVSCFGGNDGKVEIYGEGGWGRTGYTYGIDSVDLNTDGIFENLSSGYYLFHVKDSANVIVYDSIYVPEPNQLLSIVKDTKNVQCHGGSDGEVSLSVSGGIAPYAFSLDNTNWQTDSVFNGLEKGIYTFYIRDFNLCETSVEASLDQPNAFDVTYKITETLCSESNGAIECNVNGGTEPYSFQWSNNENIVGNDSIVTNLISGEYLVIITDAHVCDTSFVVAVSNTDGPQVNISSIDSVACKGINNGAIHYEITEGVAPYKVKLYSGADIVQDLEVLSLGDYSFEGLAAMNYKIVVNDVNNCLRSIDNIIVQEPLLLELQMVYLYHPVCFGDSNGSIAVTTIGGNGNNTYLWSNGSTESFVSNLVEGNYTVTVTDAKVCSDYKTFELINPEQLTVYLGEDEIICEGQTYPLSAVGYEAYNWTYNGEYISSAEGIEVWAEGIYTLEVSDQNGCFASDTFELFVSNDLLVAEFIMPSEAYINDTVVAIDISWPEPENTVWSFSPRIENISSETYFEEFTFETPGIYTISLTSYIAMCVDSVSKQIVILADTSNSEKSILGSNPVIKYFNVFPNPNNGVFSVEVDLSDYEDIVIDIYDLQRNIVITRQKAHNQKFYKFEFGFSNLNQGLYIIELYVGNDKKTEKMLVL